MEDQVILMTYERIMSVPHDKLNIFYEKKLKIWTVKPLNINYLLYIMVGYEQ